MKYLRIGLMLLMMSMSLIASAVRVTAEAEATSPQVLISELQTASQISASDEFVELIYVGHNNIDIEIDLQYRSANGTSWTSKASARLELMPGDRFLFSTDGAERSYDGLMTSGLAGGGGHVRIVLHENEIEVELDRLGWGSAIEPESVASPAPSNEQSLKRLFDEDGLVLDSDDNSVDFMLSDEPNPQSSSYVYVPIVEEPNEEQQPESEPGPEPDPEPEPEPQPPAYAELMITELLINPGSPKLDKDDEYVEIHNPNAVSVSLENYVLQTGNDNNYTYALPNLLLEADSYIAIYSKDSGLVLSNSSGKARLLKPNLEVTHQTTQYENAKDDQAWAWIDEVWQWTNQPTPAAANLTNQTEPVQQPSLSKATLGSNLANVASAESVLRNIYSEPETISNQQLSYSTLVVMAVVAILYFVYEYRQEITGAGRKFRSYFKTWRTNR